MGGYRLIGLLVAGQLFLQGCRLNPSDDTIPGTGAPDGEEKWQGLVQALGLQESAGGEDDPGVVLANPALGTIAGQLTEHLAANPGISRCAAIHDFQQTDIAPSVDGVSVFRLDYSLQGDPAPEGEAAARSGMVVIPDNGAPFSLPLVAFAHGGDTGLTYGAIAGFFGVHQQSHIIVAPAGIFVVETKNWRGSVNFKDGKPR